MVFALCLATEKADENGEERALDFEFRLFVLFLDSVRFVFSAI